MNLLSALNLAEKARRGLLSYFQRIEARDAAEEYLYEKYGIGHKRIYHSGYRHDHITYITEGPWKEVVGGIIASLLSKTYADDEARVLCGDLYLFVLHSQIARTGSDPFKSTFCRLHGSNTYESMFQFSRGMGDEYALQVIQRELSAAIGDSFG